MKSYAGMEDYALLLFGLAAMAFAINFLARAHSITAFFVIAVMVVLASAVTVCALIHYLRWHKSK